MTDAILNSVIGGQFNQLLSCCDSFISESNSNLMTDTNLNTTIPGVKTCYEKIETNNRGFKHQKQLRLGKIIRLFLKIT